MELRHVHYKILNKIRNSEEPYRLVEETNKEDELALRDLIDEDYVKKEIFTGKLKINEEKFE
ncbi:hypothetical protein SAMN02745196_03070 [Clostridium collagenovorans DSM 3089]|uniref:Uncharacterized protein n=1 Tax=Clostridium collagenovorans DSM 3089 TaxID=1121306 RepID=A0A1M5YLF2_9CLOT|nr:hypothetical protein [Clostridium collagenovorans]SHI12895.1 hypothetical protein SAMN02745196_03070 [Clostridium collagenovorans DSM 3089]